MKALSLALALSFSLSSASAATLLYGANLSGANEAPVNNSTATGTVLVTVNTTLNTMRVQASFAGLLGNSTAAHIHAATAAPFTGTAGVATTTPFFVGFPTGVTAGSMDQTYDMTLASSYNAAYITANGGTTALAFTALSTAMSNGTAYFNIHSQAFGGGEIRGFLTAVPEPSSFGFALAGVAALAGMARRRRA